ncbi:MAG: hypothetical protein CBC02_003400 [Flavobacteriaceae bacterium TMED42]|nr:MAG: hypothetical protein CBC02_003400 [Flavobacteriaceae bacterium TMED42]
MGNDFKKLGCYAKKVVIDKVNDDTLKICVDDDQGDKHTLNVGVIIESLQNVDTFGDKQDHMIDVPTLDIDYSIKKTDKIKSTDISMKWDHSSKPSVFEVKSKNEVVFSGSFSAAMEWVRKNVAECSQNIVKTKPLH